MAGHFGGNPYKFDWPAATNNPHIARYYFARGFVMPWETVLDGGCGTGYGTKLLALSAKKAIGYDVDEGCIEGAKLNNPKNCEFKTMDLDTCELPDVDVAVSFECIEHLNDMYHYAEQLRKHTRRLIIISVPLGGTSYAYVNEPPGPATEKNDFANHGDIQKVIIGDSDEWKLFNQFDYGYSHYGIYFRDQIRVPSEWEERTGFSEGQYIKA